MEFTHERVESVGARRTAEEQDTLATVLTEARACALHTDVDQRLCRRLNDAGTDREVFPLQRGVVHAAVRVLTGEEADHGFELFASCCGREPIAVVAQRAEHAVCAIVVLFERFAPSRRVHGSLGISAAFVRYSAAW